MGKQEFVRLKQWGNHVIVHEMAPISSGGYIGSTSYMYGPDGPL